MIHRSFAALHRRARADYRVNIDGMATRGANNATTCRNYELVAQRMTMMRGLLFKNYREHATRNLWLDEYCG